MRRWVWEEDKMVLGKEEIWERLRTKSVWLMPVRTPLFTIADDDHMGAGNVIGEGYMRYVVMFLFQGNGITAQTGSIEKLEEDGATYKMLISDVQIQPAAMPQIPNGGLDIESPIMSAEGGSNLYGHVNGNSINLTIVYWDNGI
jgi:hypothetical protein